MREVSSTDVSRMRQQLFFEGDDVRERLSRFWLLLLLAAVIASTGVVADSTATVIGAMIVAPLMTPILGSVLAVVLADRANLLRCLGLVVAGAVAVVLIGWMVGLLVQQPVVAATNSQVAGRVSPRLIDLLAALATGAVGSIALARDDISDTLPGVAIAISLVPPLAVAGLALEAGSPDEASGAVLLFVTNVSATRSPVAWDPKDSSPVADAVIFLLSDLARMVTGEILHVDGGYHAMAAPLR